MHERAATAIAADGPGAVLWLWLTGVFGIATKYAEAVLSVKYRITTKSGAMAGGPVCVLERGMKCRRLGLVFALLTTIAAFGIGNMVQASSVSAMVRETRKYLWQGDINAAEIPDAPSGAAQAGGDLSGSTETG